MRDLLYGYLFFTFSLTGMIPALLIAGMGTTITLILILALYGLIYYSIRSKMTITRTISFITSCIVMLGFMGYYGYHIQAESPDGQTAIALSYYSGYSVYMGIAAYFIMLIAIKLMVKIKSFIKRSR
jgi:hypothetical protein